MARRTTSTFSCDIARAVSRLAVRLPNGTRACLWKARRKLPVLLGRKNQREAIIGRLAEQYRFMPDTKERVGGNWIEIPFPKRKPIAEARAEVRDALDAIHAQWRSHLKMLKEPPP